MAWPLIKDYAPLVIMALFAAAIIATFYHFPFCEKCRDNRRTKRMRGKKICEIHGEL